MEFMVTGIFASGGRRHGWERLARRNEHRTEIPMKPGDGGLPKTQNCNTIIAWLFPSIKLISRVNFKIRHIPVLA